MPKQPEKPKGKAKNDEELSPRDLEKVSGGMRPRYDNPDGGTNTQDHSDRTMKGDDQDYS